MSNRLDFSRELIGRLALVTGGTRGIGAAIAQRLLDAGAKVVVTARARGEALPAGAVFVAGDVASASGVKAIAAGALDALGGLDILVAKAALNSYSRTLAIDLAPSKIRVNAVSPGPVTTPGSRAFSDALGAPPDFFAKDIPLGRYGAPEDVAEVVALLASDRGKWMTGAIINVDGGMSAR
jgi:NAD(P)-dependent dehydrogenase (short-subunit alcohol dehydrogenase family)